VEIFLILPMFVTIKRMHYPHKLNTDSNRNRKNIYIIKIAVENANLYRKNMRHAQFSEM